MSVKRAPLLHTILQRIAPKIGATIFYEPDWKIVGQITFASGRRSYFKYSSLDLNPMAAAELARDKDYASFFMNHMGYPVVPESEAFYSDDWAKAINAPNKTVDYAYSYAESIGFPVVIKPNSGAQGIGVVVVNNKEEFYTYATEIFKKDRLMLVQKRLVGRDFRLVVLDDQVISSYERIPLNVVGDGMSTINALLTKKQQEFLAASNDQVIRKDDYRILLKLKHQHLTMDYTPANGEQVFLLDNANLSSGGDGIDMDESMPERFKKIAINVSRDMGLKFCGVDFMIAGDINDPDTPYWILEINSAPGLDHYTQLGEEQLQKIEDMYLAILKSIESEK